MMKALGLMFGCSFLSMTAIIFSGICGRYNDRCGGAVQGWQFAILAAVVLVPIAIGAVLGSARMTRLHWLSIGANAAGIVLCLLALTAHPEHFKPLAGLIGWMLVNGAVSTAALRGKV
jgi:hypothetical protein